MSTRTEPAGSVGLDHLIALNDEILALVRAGVPLEQGLLDVGGDVGGRLGAIASALGARMRRGEGLAEALAAEGPSFPPAYRAVVEAGVRSGRLAAALEGLATFARGYADLRRAVGLALLYPVTVLAIAFGMFAGYATWVVPRFLGAFEVFRIDPGRPLRGLAWLGEHPWLWVPIGPLALLAVAAWWVGSGRAARLLSATGGPLRWVPGMGRLVGDARAAHFAELLGLLVEHGVPLPEALELAGDAAGDPPFAASARSAADAIRRGEPARAGVGSMGGLPPLLRWLLAGGVEQGRLLPALRHAAESYRRRAEDRAEVIRRLLPIGLMLALAASATLLYAVTLFYPFAALLYDLAIL